MKQSIFNRLEKALSAAGLEYRVVYVTRNATDPSAEYVPAVMVYHNYFGLYPTEESRAKSNTAARIANKLGLFCESRGYYTATLISENRR